MPVIEPAHCVVVEDEAADAPILGERSGLRFDLLSGEDSRHWRQVRVAVHEFEVAGELFDPVDVAASLDLDRDARARGIRRQNVDRAESPSCTRGAQVGGPSPTSSMCSASSFLQVRLDTVFLQARVDSEFVLRVVEHFVNRDDEQVRGLGLSDFPDRHDSGIELLGLGVEASR